MGRRLPEDAKIAAEAAGGIPHVAPTPIVRRTADKGMARRLNPALGGVVTLARPRHERSKEKWEKTRLRMARPGK